MIEIIKGRVFINGNQTKNPEFIGYAVLDFAETVKKEIKLQSVEIIELKAIQKYLLLHGSNDESINEKIRELNNDNKQQI